MKKTFIVLTAAIAVSCSDGGAKSGTASTDTAAAKSAGTATAAASTPAGDCGALQSLVDDLDKNNLKNHLGEKDNSKSSIEEYKVKDNLPEFTEAAIDISSTDTRYGGMTPMTKSKDEELKHFETLKGKYAPCLSGYKMTDISDPGSKLPNYEYHSANGAITVTMGLADFGGDYASVIEIKKKK